MTYFCPCIVNRLVNRSTIYCGDFLAKIKNSSIQNSATPKPCILDDFGRRRTQIYRNKSRTNAAESAIRQGFGAGSNYYCYPKVKGRISSLFTLVLLTEKQMKLQRFTSIFLLFCLLFSSMTLTSCDVKKDKYVTYCLDYFDTATTITGYEKDQKTFDKVSGEMLELLGEYHRLFTIYHRFDGLENLCTINKVQNGAHQTVTVDKRIIEMLSYAKEMYRVTGGRINIAMGSVLSIWHDYRTAGIDEPWAAELPPMDLLEKAAEHTDINDLIIDEKNSTVTIADPQMTLDVGAIAKGYAVEMVARHFEEKGITGYVINVGGNVRTLGTKPNGEKWIAGIENPNTDSEEAYVSYLALAGESVVTSGSYQRYYTVGDKNYHHIIDSSTLMPAEGYLSVSVICKNSAEGDALSTALFCMSLEEGLALVESLDDVEALWIMKDESTRSSSGFSKYVTEP